VSSCPDVTAFIDCELDPIDAMSFRAHVADCLDCQRKVTAGMQLSAQLSTLADRSDLEWLLEDVSARLAKVPECSCHNELRHRLSSCTSMLVRMTERL
jgi:hypothetical protein